MTEKKKIRMRKKQRSADEFMYKELTRETAEEIDREILKDLLAASDPGSTVADPEDGQLQFGFLDFGSFFDSSDPEDVK